MPTRLYLDTARLGLATRRVQRAHRDFARLASEEGLTLYASRLLSHGFDACPQSFQHRYPGLRDWQGVAELKTALSELALRSSDCPVLLASRSTQLMKLAARLLFQRCGRVLTTDLAWPGYAETLDRERNRVGGETVRVPLRHGILWDRLDSDAVANRVAAFCRQFNCDGLFLTAVSHDGIRLPINAICERVREKCDLRFVVVDGAQAFNHTPPEFGDSSVDVFLVGAHKWLRAMQPLGMAFLPNNDSQDFIHDTCRQMLACADIDDPLLTLTEHLEHNHLPAFSETVNTLPLFTTQAAATDALMAPLTAHDRFATQLANAEVVADLCDEAGWQPVRPEAELRSGILLVRSRRIVNVPSDQLQSHFARFGIGLTAYANVAPNNVKRLGNGVTISGNRITLDLSGLSLDTPADLYLDLVTTGPGHLEQVQAIMEAANELNAPVIMQASAGARKYAGGNFLRHLNRHLSW